MALAAIRDVDELLAEHSAAVEELKGVVSDLLTEENDDIYLLRYILRYNHLTS